MNATRLHVIAVGLAAIGAAVALAVWFGPASKAPDVSLRLPGQTRRLSTAPAPRNGKPKNPGTLIPGPGKPSPLEGSWPQFRGADRTNIVHDAANLARTWAENEPRVLWRVEVGEGYAGPAVHNGRVYLMDYDREKEEDALRCLSLDDGQEIWRYTYSVKIKRNHGMSRTVPAVSDEYVVGLGPKGHVTCLDARSGRRIWAMDLVKDFGAEIPPWYAGQCPLIEGDAVILAPGGDPLMMAVDLATGRIRWRTPNPGGWKMTHSSIMPMTFRGEREYVYCTTRGVVGVSASDGRLRWTYPGWTIKLATVPSPVPTGDGRIFLSGGYHSGCAMIRLAGAGESVRVEEVFRLPHTVFGADQHTPILYNDYLYGIVPKKELACLDLDGNLVWSSGPANRFGRQALGPYLLADGLLFVLNDSTGTLHLIEADPAGYHELARRKLLDGHEAWGPMAMAAGRLLLRDLTTLVCVEVPKSR